MCVNVKIGGRYWGSGEEGEGEGGDVIVIKRKNGKCPKST
jgi:hypothetical protein